MLVWLRRDLRLTDHAALGLALAESRHPIQLCFVYDEPILAGFRQPSDEPTPDRRLGFIQDSLAELQTQLEALGGTLLVGHGAAIDLIPQWAAQLGVDAVVTAEDYEPAALERDDEVARRLQAQGRQLIQVKDQTVFAKSEVLTGADRPYSVFTPYKRAWLKLLEAQHQRAVAPASPEPAALAGRLANPAQWPTALQGLLQQPSLESMGFGRPCEGPALTAGESGAETLLVDFLKRIGRYQQARDYPGIKGPSYLSVHLRFGTVSVRRLVREALAFIDAHQAIDEPTVAKREGAETWLSELIWRDFYMQILHHFPKVTAASFKPEYDRIAWADRADWLKAWKAGQTGYPIVDAGMRQLAQTGYMHNRLRMVVASFLTKDLGISWKAGEAHFAHLLNDFDLAANNGGWQWAASSGCDAQPYFRIFNPVSQSEKFDPKGDFIRRYVPELSRLPEKFVHAPWEAPALILEGCGVRLGVDYPRPIVDHAAARAETLERYAVVKKAG